MEKLILRYAKKTSHIAKACVWLPCIVFLMLPRQLLAQADTIKKLKEVKIGTSAIPRVQSLLPSQQIGVNDFDRYSAFTVADAIRNFSGVNIKDYGGIGGLKTVSVRSLGANHLGVLYDGIELNDTETGQVDLGRINLNNVQDITLYNGQPTQICQPARSFASASILAITTFKPNLDSIKPYQLQLGIKGGSFGFIDPYVQWQQRISRQWFFVLNSYIEKATGNYKFKTTNDASDTLATRSNDDVSVQQIDGALYWVKNDNNKFSLHVNYYNSDRGLPGAVIPYNPFSRVRYYDQDFFIQSSYQHSWQNTFHLLINSKFSQTYNRYVDPDFQNGTGGKDDRYTEHEFYQSAALSYNLTTNWQVSYAIDALLSNLSLAPNLNHYAYPTRFTLLNALASNLTVGKWLFQGSLLATNISEHVQSGSVAPPVAVLSPTIMASFNTGKNLQLRAFYKDVFRDPTFGEQYYFSTIQSRNIKPEYAKQFDAGLTYSKSLNGLFSYITFTADGYYNRVTNKIISIPNQNLVISSIINLGTVAIKGLDVGAKTQVMFSNNYKGLLSVNYTYQQALDVTDPTSAGQSSSTYNNQIPYTPEHIVNFNIGIIRRHFGVYYNQTISSYYYYLGQNLPENYIDGYSVSDVTAVYNFAAKNKPVTLSANVDNIFNTRYAIVRSFPMPGVSARLSFQITI